MKNVVIYTDGACSGNPGDGGWATILMYGTVRKEISGYQPNTTNNRMELQAVISALSALKESCHVDLYTDSAYVSNAVLQGWIDNWQQNGWQNSSKKMVKNIDLWQQLLLILKQHEVVFHKVKGHSTSVHNNRCDELAVAEIKKHNIEKV